MQLSLRAYFADAVLPGAAFEEYNIAPNFTKPG